MTRRITKIEKQVKRDRFNVYLDGVYEFSLACKVLDKQGLEEDQELTEEQIDGLKQIDQEYKAYNRAILILSYRANTEKELKTKLSKHFEPKAIDKVIEKLKDQGLLNDPEMAERYVENSKKGKRLVKLELLKKGIDKEVIENAIQEKNNEIELENARKAAEKVLKKYEKSDLQTKRQKLYENLIRKGFSYDTFKQIIKDF